MAGPDVPADLNETDVPAELPLWPAHKLYVPVHTYSGDTEGEIGTAVWLDPMTEPGAGLLGPFRSFEPRLATLTQP